MKCIALASVISVATFLFGSTSFPDFSEKRVCANNKEILLTTHWKQMGGFEKFTPDKLRLGCWSTALAQIAFYHKLTPQGTVNYTSRQGYEIHENLDSASFDFTLFQPTIDSTSSPAAVDQMAWYNYYAALAVQKDFGTDRYMNKLTPSRVLETHYKARVSRYISWKESLPNTRGKLEKIICREIQAKRPVFLHFANLKDFGHSVVIDGCCYDNGVLMIHTNQGQGGPTDGWYAFNKGILRDDDLELRVIYTIKPR